MVLLTLPFAVILRLRENVRKALHLSVSQRHVRINPAPTSTDPSPDSQCAGPCRTGDHPAAARSGRWPKPRRGPCARTGCPSQARPQTSGESLNVSRLSDIDDPRRYTRAPAETYAEDVPKPMKNTANNKTENNLFQKIACARARERVRVRFRGRGRNSKEGCEMARKFLLFL